MSEVNHILKGSDGQDIIVTISENNVRSEATKKRVKAYKEALDKKGESNVNK